MQHESLNGHNEKKKQKHPAINFGVKFENHCSIPERYNGLFPSVHRAVDDATLLRPPGHVPWTGFRPQPPCDYSDIDERQFRVDGGAIKNIYQTVRRTDSFPRA